MAPMNDAIGSAAPPPAVPARVVVGYTAGAFDVFHVGHLNLLRRAREACDFLIVGVTTDELVEQVKGAAPFVPFLERMAIVQSVRYVDQVVPQTTMDKTAVWTTLKWDVLFVGDNMRGAQEWDRLESAMIDVGVRVIYLPATHTDSGELLQRVPDPTEDRLGVSPR